MSIVFSIPCRVTSRMISTFVVLVLSAFSTQTNAVAEELTVPRHCPSNVPTCVMIDLNFIWSEDRRQNVAEHPLVVEEKLSSDPQIADTRLNLQGRLNDMDEEKHAVTFERFHEGMDCQDFSVPAIGFGTTGRGIIITDKGSLEITSKALTVGCDDCVAVIRKNDSSSISYFKTPTWNQNLFGKSVFSSNGRVYWQISKLVAKGGQLERSDPQCFDLNATSHFMRISSDNCTQAPMKPASPSTVEHLHDDFNEDRAIRLQHDLYTIEGSPYTFYRYGVSCS